MFIVYMVCDTSVVSFLERVHFGSSETVLLTVLYRVCSFRMRSGVYLDGVLSVLLLPNSFPEPELDPTRCFSERFADPHIHCSSGSCGAFVLAIFLITKHYKNLVSSVQNDRGASTYASLTAPTRRRAFKS